MRYWLTFAIACSSPQPQVQATTQVTTSPADAAQVETRAVDAGVRADAAIARIDAAAAPRTCVAKPNPTACPATEPNINASCPKAKLECAYGSDCCKPVYVCLKQKGDRQRRFEAHFRGCE